MVSVLYQTSVFTPVSTSSGVRNVGEASLMCRKSIVVFLERRVSKVLMLGVGFSVAYYNILVLYHI